MTKCADFYSVLSGGSTSESDPDTASQVAEVETEEDEVTYFDTRDFLCAESIRSASCRRKELITNGCNDQNMLEILLQTLSKLLNIPLCYVEISYQSQRKKRNL